MMSMKSMEELSTMLVDKRRKLDDLAKGIEDDPFKESEYIRKLHEDPYYRGLDQDCKKLAAIYYREINGKEKENVG
jgi:hypothetical protein